MLSSIHPLGEAGRGQRWWLTVAAHVVGSALGGALVGLALGGLGQLAAWAGVPLGVRAVVAVAVAVVAVVVDARGWPAWLWRPHRQVDEDWLARYRGWVYGGGFGFQLGMGITTIVTAATVYVVGALAWAMGSVVVGVVLGLVFGSARGATVLWARGITTPDALVGFHRRLQERARWGRMAAVAGDLAVVAVTTMLVVGEVR